MRSLAYLLAVFVVVLLAYAPSVRYDFVSFDDYEYVYCNPNVMTGVTGENLHWAMTNRACASNWHPLAWTSLQADASVVKVGKDGKGRYLDAPLGKLASAMHAHNVCLHAANAALLFVLIVLMARRLVPEGDDNLLVAALVVLLWAIHPLRTEVVCWVSERKELLSVFWMLAALILWTGCRTVACVVLALACFGLALAAKPVAVTLPVVLFAWDWVATGRRFGRTLASVAPFLLLSAGACALTLMAQTIPLEAGARYSFADRAVMSLSAPAIYLRQTVWPSGLSAFYPSRPPVPWAELCVGVALVVGMVGVCAVWMVWRRSRVLALVAFAVAWCYVSLVPMLGIVKVGDQPHSDRYTYWAGCGLAAVVALAVFRYVRISKWKLSSALAAVVAALTVATQLRMPVWRNSFSLYADCVPKSWADQPVRALTRLLLRQGEEGQARAEGLLRMALTQGGSHDVRAEFAYLLAVRAQGTAVDLGARDPAFAEARFEAQTVLANDPEHGIANEALAVVEMKEGHWEDAARHLVLARRRAEQDDIVERIDGELGICRERMAIDR